MVGKTAVSFYWLYMITDDVTIAHIIQRSSDHNRHIQCQEGILEGYKSDQLQQTDRQATEEATFKA